MSSHSTTRLGTRPATPLFSVLRGWTTTLRRAHAARQARRHLQGLDDHILRDIGLTRWQIRSGTRDGRY